MDDLQPRLQTALELARTAGAIISDNFGKQHVVDLKDDRSPVTAIDRLINTLVGETLKKAHPEDGMLGEEGNVGDGTEPYQWLCDPLDGTRSFILGLPNGIFMLGLSKDGIMLLSVIYNPYTDSLYHAVKGQGAYCNDKPLHVSNAPLADGYVLVGTDSLGYGAALKKTCRGIEPVGGTGIKCTMIADGRSVGMIKNGAVFYDIGPGSLLVEEAGGKVTDLHGNPLHYGRPLDGVVVSNGVAHDNLLKIARKKTI